MLAFDIVKKPISPFCIYCLQPIVLDELGWGWFISGERWHTECLQIEGNVDLSN